MDSARFNWEGRTSPALLSLLGVSMQKADALTKFPVLLSYKCGYFHVQKLFVPSLCIRTDREAQGAISKSTASALFSVLL